MPTVRFVKRFGDRQAGKTRRRGEIAEVSEERAKQLRRIGAAEIVQEPKPRRIQIPVPAAEEEPQGLADLTVKQLRELAEERGIDLPKYAKKDDLISLLESNEEQGS